MIGTNNDSSDDSEYKVIKKDKLSSYDDSRLLALAKETGNYGSVTE